MRIAIDLERVRSLPGVSTGPQARISSVKWTWNELEFIEKSLNLLTLAYPQDEWVNLPQIKTTGLRRLLPQWRNKARVLTEIKPDVLITDLPPAKRPDFPVIWYCGAAATLLPKFREMAEKADFLVVSSTFVQRQIIAKGIDPEKVKLVFCAPEDETLWLDWHQKYAVKQQMAGSRDFFLAFADIGKATNWEKLFKAFSIFKKWQQSEIQLLIAGAADETFEKEFEEKLDSYKYRQDVKLVEADTNVPSILSAAYGVIIHRYDPTGMDILNCLKAGVPVITNDENIISEKLLGCYLPSSGEGEETGRQLINLFRDEQLRDVLVEKGKEAVNVFNWEETCRQWYNIISKLRPN